MSRPEAYLLDELGPEEAAAFERAMAGDPALQAEVERLRPVVARLGACRPRRGRASSRRRCAMRMPEAAPKRRLVLRPLVAAVCAVALLAGGHRPGRLARSRPVALGAARAGAGRRRSTRTPRGG